MTEQFWWCFLESLLFKGNIRYMLNFSNFQVVRPFLVFVWSCLLRDAATSARFMQFWCDPCCLARRGDLALNDHTFWAEGHSEDTGHSTFYSLGFITQRLNHLSKLCGVSHSRYTHSCIQYGSFVWEYKSVQMEIKEGYLHGLDVVLNSLYSALAFW